MEHSQRCKLGLMWVGLAPYPVRIPRLKDIEEGLHVVPLDDVQVGQHTEDKMRLVNGARPCLSLRHQRAKQVAVKLPRNVLRLPELRLAFLVLNRQMSHHRRDERCRQEDVHNRDPPPRL